MQTKRFADLAVGDIILSVDGCKLVVTTLPERGMVNRHLSINLREETGDFTWSENVPDFAVTVVGTKFARKAEF